MAKYAYVTLVMRGNSYCIGAVTLAYSLRLHKCKHDIICMVTKDVDEIGRKLLSTVFTEVIEVDYIKFETIKPKDSPNSTFNSWIDYSFTKFHIFKLTQYEKIAFVDADMIILSNIDNVFEFKTPALTLFDATTQFTSHKPSESGEVIKADIILRKLSTLIACNAGFFIINPDVSMFDRIIKLCELLVPIRYIGKPLVFSGAEELILFLFFIACNKSPITFIGAEYNTFSGNLHRWYRVNKKLPCILHFAIQKPWSADRFEYPDTAMWWQMFDNYVKSADSKVIDLVNRLSIKLEKPLAKVNNTTQIITEGNLYNLFLKLNFSNMKCIYCTHWNTGVNFLNKIPTDHKTKDCPFIGVT